MIRHWRDTFRACRPCAAATAAAPSQTRRHRSQSRARASKNIGTRKSGVPTYRIRSRQLLRIQSVFFGAALGTAGTVCGRENALRSCIGLSAKCLLTRRQNQYWSYLFRRKCLRIQPTVGQNCERDEAWLSELTAKYLENWRAIDHPLQHIS